MLINTQIDPLSVANPTASLPSINTADLVNVMRVDKSLGSPRIAYYIETAYDNINGQVACCIGRNCVHSPIWRRAYKRAVLHESAALMSDDHLDFDSTAQGVARSENQLTKSGRLRRIVNHAVADMTGRSRNRIKLL